MDAEKNEKRICRKKTSVYLKAACSIVGLIVISTVLWITGCEIVCYGTLWIGDTYRMKNRFYVYKITALVFFLCLGLVIVVASVSLVLFGIPFTVVHIDHLFNRQRVQISHHCTTNHDSIQNENSKQALKWTITIFILVIIGLTIGAVGCEIMEWSGLKFKALFNTNYRSSEFHVDFKQYSFLAVMFAGLLLFFLGFSLAPFMLAFAGIVSFDKKKNSYRLRPRRPRHRPQPFQNDDVTEV